jgi:DNA-binding CsgD family transcriptional regulator
MRHAAGHIVYEHKFIDESAMGKNEFYDWLDREHGLGYFLGSRIYDEGDISVFHSIEFSKKHGHPDKDTVDTFRSTSRALGNAWLSANRVLTPALTNQLKAWTPDHLPWSIFALSTSGKVLEMNSAAQALIERDETLSIWDDTLIPRHKLSLDAFQRGIKAATNGEGFDMLLFGSKKNTRYIAKLVPVNTLELFSPLPVAFLFYVWDPIKKGNNIKQALHALWGLTHAEAALAMYLSNGDSLTSAAEKLGVSRNTARNQLQSIFSKTNTKRQSELVAHILGVIDY